MESFETNSSIPREVFRNDTTAVEVVVKQIKNKKKIENPNHNVEALVEINDRLCEDMAKLKRELNKANRNLEDMKKCFRLVTFEIVKQLDAANQRELKQQTQYLLQQLEKEKLKTVLESKTNLVRKLRKELINVKRFFKKVIKGIRHVVPLSETFVQSDLEYTEFESDMKMKLPNTHIVNKMFGSHEASFETIFSNKV
ncbi:jg9121 [Pararge aegeria aegeria]|uniref:Jg9121 protein n=1 Tax=Pararge aegeria aegeria TaxID=348720 RepID=A0A8S4SL98_9NEOP|nr:jg9121 [Pararge aegeria aegeria]